MIVFPRETKAAMVTWLARTYRPSIFLVGPPGPTRGESLSAHIASLPSLLSPPSLSLLSTTMALPSVRARLHRAPATFSAGYSRSISRPTRRQSTAAAPAPSTYACFLLPFFILLSSPPYQTSYSRRYIPAGAPKQHPSTTARQSLPIRPR
jgi:hypothetical protein